MSGKNPDVAAVFQALGDPTRRALLEALTAGPVSVSRLAEPLEMTLAAVVQHLQILEQAGLVTTEKVGRVRTCSVAEAGLAVARQWLEDRRPVWDRRLEKLGKLLGEDAD